MLALIQIELMHALQRFETNGAPRDRNAEHLRQWREMERARRSTPPRPRAVTPKLYSKQPEFRVFRA